MCGIAGWVDYERNESELRTGVVPMTATMADRGPDAEGVWSGAHVALGHRRLAVIDIEGGKQPMVVADGDGPVLAALTYSGEVYNFTELRAELEAHGHRFRTRSDTEVVLHAYLEWGDGFAERLNGMYAFALWDARREELLLVRDRMGIKPLYYMPTRDGVLFGSEPKAILAAPGVRAEMDLDGLRELLSFTKTPGHGIFRDMYEVRPGEIVRVGRGGLRTRRYWRLEAREHTDDRDTTVATVRGLLDDIVARQLVSDVPLCTLLSGGLDSSAVTALAQRALREGTLGEGRTAERIRSFAVDYAGQEDRFQADEMRETPDGPYVRDLVAHVGPEHQDIVLSPKELLAPGLRETVLRARDVPVGMGDMDTSLYLLFRAIRERSTVALSGESADEVFGGYRWFHDPEAINSGTFPWMAYGMRGPAAGGGVVSPEIERKLDLDGYRRQRYAEALAEVPRLPGEDGLERRMREVCYLHLTRFVQILLDRKDRMSMAVGLEVRVPFCDHRLVEYVFNTPWAMKTFDGREKSLLRAATRDVLPESIAERVKSPYPATQDPEYERALRSEVAGLLADDDAPARALIDPAPLREVLASPLGEVSDQRNRFGMEIALQLNTWLSGHDVALNW